MANAKVMKDGRIFIDAVVAEYNHTSTPISRKAQYHANEYCLAAFLKLVNESEEAFDPLKEEAKKVDGELVLNNDGNGFLYNFYSKFPFKLVDNFGDFSTSNRIPNLKEGTELRICLVPMENKFRKSGVHYVVDTIKVVTLQKYKNAFADDEN